MTVLPVIETQLGDVSSYIPTNVISITDGQIFLDTDIFNSGVRPAVNVGISVSRVGGSAQTKAMRKVAGRLRLDLAQYREKAQFSLFSEDIDKGTKLQLVRGKIITEILKQGKNVPMSLEDQVVVLYGAVNGYFDSIEISKIGIYEKELLSFMHRSNSALMDDIKNEKDITPKIEEELKKSMETFKGIFNV